jgi:hypothetical protein
MGRPSKENPKKQYTIMLDPKVVKRIDIIAKNSHMSRSELMSNLMLLGLDFAKIYDVFGITSAVGISRKLIEKIQEWKSEGKIIFNNEDEFKIVDTEK